MKSVNNHIIINESFFKDIYNYNNHSQKINRLINLIVNENRECLFDTEKTRSDFSILLEKIKLDSCNEAEFISKIDTIFQKIINPVAMILLRTVLPDQTEYKIEISKACLANCFGYFEGKFRLNGQATVITIDQPISKESLDSLAAHVIGRDWKFSNIQIVDEMIALAHLYNEDHFSEQVALKALDFLATKGNEKDFNDRYVKGCEKVFLEQYFCTRGAKYLTTDHVDIRLEDFIKMGTSASDNLALFLRQQSPSIRLIIEENFDPVSVLLLPDEFLDLISSFVFTQGEGIGWGFPLENYKRIQHSFPTKSIYPLLNSTYSEEKLDPFSLILYSAYMRHQERKCISIFPICVAYAKLENDAEYGDLLLKEVTNCLVESNTALSEFCKNQFTEALINFPNNPFLLTLLGVDSMIRQGKDDLSEPINYFTKALQQDPKNICILIYLSRCLIMLAQYLRHNKQEAEAFDKYAESEKCCREGLKLQPTLVILLEHLAVSLEAQGNYLSNNKQAFDKYAESEKCCREGLKLQPTHIILFEYLAVSLGLQGNYLSLNNQKAKAFDKYTEVEKCCREGLKLQPTHIILLERLALSLRNQARYLNINNQEEALNKYIEVENYCREGLKLQPVNIIFIEYLTLSLRIQAWHLQDVVKQEEEAFNKYIELGKYCLKGLKLQPTHAKFLDHLIFGLTSQSIYLRDRQETALRDGRGKAAFNKDIVVEEYCREGHKLQPTHVTFLEFLVQSLERQARYLRKHQKAQAAFDKDIAIEEYCRKGLTPPSYNSLLCAALANSLLNQAKRLKNNRRTSKEGVDELLFEAEERARKVIQMNQATKFKPLLLKILFEQMGNCTEEEKKKKVEEYQKYYKEIMQNPANISRDILDELQDQMKLITPRKRPWGKC